MTRHRYPVAQAGAHAWRVVAVVALAAWLAGCVATGPSPAVAEPVADAAPPEEPTPSRPAVNLDGDLVYDYLLADIAERRGQAQVAVAAAVRVAERTGDPLLVLRAFRAALRTGDTDAALAMAGLLAETGDDPVHAGFARVQALLGAGRDDEAVTEVGTMLADWPDQRERVFNNASEAFAQQADPERFLPRLQTLADAYPDDRHGYFALAYLASRVGRPEALGEAIDRALALDPDWEQAAIVRYIHLVQSDRAAEAQAFADQFIDTHPQALALAERQARLLAASGEMAAALERFEYVLRRQGDNSELLIATALTRMQLEQYSGARRLLLRHLELNPRSDETRMQLGQLAYLRERYDESIAWYGEVTDETLVFEAQRRLGSALLERDGPEAALDHLAGLVPSSLEEEVDLLLGQEQVLRQLGRLEDAYTLVDGALQDIPDNGDLLYSRALLAAELGRLPEHERDIRQVIAMEPENAHAYNALGYTLADQTSRFDEALELISRALELAPEDPFILDSMGWVQFRLGRLREAEEYLRRALAIRSDAEIAAHLGEVLWADGMHEEARRLWDEALDRDPQNKTLRDTLDRLDPR